LPLNELEREQPHARVSEVMMDKVTAIVTLRMRAFDNIVGFPG
jgi:hypothetical protein